jgi:hypothetical protein
MKTGKHCMPNKRILAAGRPNPPHWIFRLLCMMLLLPFFVWGVFALWWGSWPQWVCLSLLGVYVLIHVGAIVFSPKRFLIVFCFLAFLIPLISFLLMQPSHDRNWQPDVAQMPYADISGSTIVVHNIRNCDYITETDYVPRYETRTYDISKLKSVDIMLTDWGLKYIAHTMISFGFDGDQYLCFSIETRKEVGETYSAVKGFFRQYELIYIAGDEKDLVRLRTNFRVGEDLYLYRLRVASMDNARKFFMEYINRINQLYQHPEWYNALTENCMTGAFRLARKHAAPGRGKWHWSIILNGFADRHAYENKTIDTSLPFEELKKTSKINSKALSLDHTADFSYEIRRGLPGMQFKYMKGE